jgi:hypothetical protein
MRRFTIAVRVLVQCLLVVGALALLWLARTAYVFGRGQDAVYAVRLAHGWAAAGVLAALCALADAAHLRRLRAAPPDAGVARGDVAWLVVDLLACPAACGKALVALATVAAGASFRAATVGNLASIRGAITLYAEDNGRRFPSDLAQLTGKYESDVPRAHLWLYHPDSAAVRLGASSDDSGGWLYDNVPGDANYGRVSINCTHTDWRGTAWSAY